MARVSSVYISAFLERHNRMKEEAGSLIGEVLVNLADGRIDEDTAREQLEGLAAMTDQVIEWPENGELPWPRVKEGS